jgi:large subunit ribosomal protein L9
MELILMRDVPSLGKRGDIVKVSAGYARNYLIPKGDALPSSDAARHQLAEQEKQAEQRENRARREANQMANQLRRVSLTARVRVGDEDRIFGRVSAGDISSLLKEKGFNIDKKKIILEEPINSLGIFTVEIKLHPEVTTRVKLWVVKE